MVCECCGRVIQDGRWCGACVWHVTSTWMDVTFDTSRSNQSREAMAFQQRHGRPCPFDVAMQACRAADAQERGQ